MEIDIEQELQILKSEYNTLKKELKKQDTLNEKFFKSIRKQPALAVSKEIKSRQIIIHAFYTEKIAGYRKFYDWALIGSIIPLIVMLTYIFMHLYARADNPTAVQLITISGIVFIILAIANTLFQYKKHVQRCKELLKQFEE